MELVTDRKVRGKSCIAGRDPEGSDTFRDSIERTVCDVAAI
jgi:hypothetical protein